MSEAVVGAASPEDFRNIVREARELARAPDSAPAQQKAFQFTKSLRPAAVEDVGYLKLATFAALRGLMRNFRDVPEGRAREAAAAALMALADLMEMAPNKLPVRRHPPYYARD